MESLPTSIHGPMKSQQPLLEGIFQDSQGIQGTLSIFADYLTFGKTRLPFNGRDWFSFVKGQDGQEIGIQFYIESQNPAKQKINGSSSDPLYFFKKGQWREEEVSAWDLHLTGILNNQLNENEFLLVFKPLQILDNLSDNLFKIYRGERRKDRIHVVIKATNKKLMEDNPEFADQIRSQAARLKDMKRANPSKPENGSLIGVFDTPNTFYIVRLCNDLKGLFPHYYAFQKKLAEQD